MGSAVWTCFDRDWRLEHPPAWTIGDRAETQTIQTLTDELVMMVTASQADDFRAALEDDEDLDIEMLIAMVDSARALLYPMPWGTVLSLWSHYEDNQPLLHGRLLLQGNPKGTESLNTWDAACLALVLHDENWRGLPGWSFNEKGRPELYRQLGINQKVVGTSEADALAALSAEIGMKSGQTAARPSKRPPKATE